MSFIQNKKKEKDKNDDQHTDIAKNDVRNYGIDALKIIAMFMVLVLHILGAGGVLEASENGSAQYHVAWLMEIGSYPAVNIFGLTTGYLMINNRWKMSRVIGLWLQIFCYSVGINLFFAIFSSDVLTVMDWIRSFLPVSYILWWYATAYFGLFFLIPFINKMINGLSKKQAVFLAAIILIFYSLLNNLIVEKDVFNMSGGYTLAWLVCLYIWGALIRKFDFAATVKKYWFAIIYLVSIVLVWVSRLALGALLNGAGKENSVIQSLFRVDMFVCYLSPFIVVAAIALLLFFAKVQFPKKINKMLKSVSALSFAVYIIHLHRRVYPRIITGKYAYLATENIFVLMGVVFLIALSIFLACILIELLRTQVFKWLKINKLVDKISRTLDEKVGFGHEGNMEDKKS